MSEPPITPAPTESHEDALGLLLTMRPAFLRFVTARVESPAVAEDILQDAYARAPTQVASLREKGLSVGWFYRVLRNAVIDHRRRRDALGRALSGFTDEADVHSAHDDQAGRTVCACVSRVARTLKPEYAEALQSIEVEGKSVKAFAEENGISSGNAAVRVFRARESLRKQVSLTCGACAADGCSDCSCGPA